MRIAVIGNCQANLLAEIIAVKLPHAEVFSVLLHQIDSKVPSETQELLEKVRSSTFVFSLQIRDERYGEFVSEKLEKSVGVEYFPFITFTGYHPDCVYIDEGKVLSPIGTYHSAIAVLAFKAGYSVNDTCKLFNTKVFESLGYFEFFERELENLMGVLIDFNIPRVEVESVESWFRESKMMHSINHPKIELLDMISTKLLNGSGIVYEDFKSSDYMMDRFTTSTIFPMFPSIAESINQKGSFAFKADDATARRSGHKIYHLEEFLQHSFVHYKKIDAENLSNPRFSKEYCEKAEGIFINYLKDHTPSHPYKIRDNYSFWRKAISSVAMEEVDPVVRSSLKVRKHHKIATAGSCFAQHIAKRLANSGYNYFVAEKAPDSMSVSDAIKDNYDVFSARYGNIYTTRQLLQLFDRAFGDFEPTLHSWVRPDGKYVDPFRPQITDDGYSSESEVLSDQKEHLDIVRSMFEELDVFVFTLGLTEAWINIGDGSVLPISPGVVAGEFDLNKYKFANFTIGEVSSDLEMFLSKLRKVNRKAKVLLTVSPVPLMATYEDRHVLVSTTLSKSILRVVAEEISVKYDNVTYFPSYEIITGSFNKGSYFEDDLRSVASEGVDHVMKLFMKHCTIDSSISNNVKRDAEAEELAGIVCDEEALDV